MATHSKIEWTEQTWNPVTGCTKISKGCKHCYAERMAKRLTAMENPRYRAGFKTTMHEDLISLPSRWAKPRRVFVNSMSDLFHEDVSDDFISRIFRTMNETPRHTFQILTKRSERLKMLASQLKWTENIWMGVSVENAEVVGRISDLEQTSAQVKFLSCEPLIGPLKRLPLERMDWVIVGGESGPGARPMLEEWVEDILKQCRKSGAAFFFKQWGGVRKHTTGRTLKGKIYDEFPNSHVSVAA